MVTRIVESDNLCEMAKLMTDFADKSICGDFGKFIYFSQSLDSHGPRIKFYGGTKETGTTRKAPTMSFTNDGDKELILQPWMNKKNCPNAFDDNYIENVENFIDKLLPILLLVWYEKLDEGFSQKYFEGFISLKDLLRTSDFDPDIVTSMMNIVDMNELHEFCKKNNLYKF